MKIQPHQIQQYANQERRIKAAGNFALVISYGYWIEKEETGTFYSERFKNPNPYNFTIKVNAETAESIKNLWNV